MHLSGQYNSKVNRQQGLIRVNINNYIFLIANKPAWLLMPYNQLIRCNCGILLISETIDE